MLGQIGDHAAEVIGVILGGLTDLYKVTGDTSYLSEATNIANSAISKLVDSNGILLEPGGCETGNAGPQTDNNRRV